MSCDIFDVYGHHDWVERETGGRTSELVFEFKYSCNGCSASLTRYYTAVTDEGYEFENGDEKRCPYNDEHSYDDGSVTIVEESFIETTEGCKFCNFRRKQRFYYDGEKQELD